MGYIKFNVDGNAGSGIIAQEQIINIDKIIIVRAGLGGASDDTLNFVTGILPDQDPTVPDNPEGYVEQLALRGTGFTAATVKRANDAIIASRNNSTGVVGPGVVVFEAASGETFTHINYLVSKQ
tara:strand:- start:282 stop:653 length:372 start_codon:yes stop_codon:yes gene_type:complete